MTAKNLRNKKVLITAGPTREYWDPVRFLTNASSGAMGIAMAQAARERGARVTLVLGPIPYFPSPLVGEGKDGGAGKMAASYFSPPAKGGRKFWKGIKVVPVVSGWEMYEAVKKNLSGTDIFVGAAAVVDYRPASPLKRKIKHLHPKMTLQLYGNPDIIAMVGHLDKRRPRCVVGFALETDHMLVNAREKLFRKRMDWIVANRESNMGQSQGTATLLSRWGHRIPLKKMIKDRLAARIWDRILQV